MIWIPLTLLAVVMQTARTAGQKRLTEQLDPLTVTYVRYLFGLPFVLAYLAVLTRGFTLALPTPNPTFVIFSIVASLGQIAATVLLLQLFSLRTFVVGTTYVRAEAFLTAVLGALFFGEAISVLGWSAIVISVSGVLVLTVARSGSAEGVGTPWSRSAALGLASGLLFAITSLSLRRASLSFGSDDFLLSAALVLVTMVVIQTSLLTLWLALRSPSELRHMARRWRPCLFVGATSAAGSAGWFTAMTVERASYVKALGQVEFVLALGVSVLFFRERTSRLELAGMALVGAGILVLLRAS